MTMTSRALLGLTTFTRTGAAATRVNDKGLIETVAADVPRIDYDPTTRAPRGLLIEEGQTNVCLRSAEFDNATWAKIGAAVTANQIMAPNGLPEADFLREDGTTGQHVLVQGAGANISSTSDPRYFAVWLKSGGRTKVSLRITQASGFYVNFDLTSGTVTGSGGLFGGTAPSLARIVPFADGWFRCMAGGTFNAGNIGLQVGAQIKLLDAAGADSYVGDNASGVYAWGAQVGASLNPTSYIPTTTASVARGADICTISGAAFTGLFNSTEGTFLFDGDCDASGVRALLSVDDNTANEAMRLYSSGADPKFIVVDGGATQADIDAGTITALTRFRLAARYKTNAIGLSLDGAIPVSDLAASLPTVDRLRLGCDQAGNYLNGHIRRLEYAPAWLTDAQMMTLSGAGSLEYVR